MTDSLQLIFTALGNAILNSIWQTEVLWLLILIYSRSKHVAPARLSSISFIALLLSFMGFIVTFLVSFWRPQLNFGIVQWLDGFPYIHSFIFYAAMAYLLLLIVPFTKLFLGIRDVYILKKQELGKVPGHLKIFLLDASQHLGIKRKVRIFTSRIISSPLTVGFIKPVILLPVAMLNQLSIRQAEAIILHELAHIKRNDYLQNIVTQIILSILYFNPFAKLIGNMQHLEREKSADKWVLQFEYNNWMYANTLLQLAQQNVFVQNRFTVPASGKNSPLIERVEWLFGTGKRKYPPLKSLLILGTLVIAVCSITMIKKTGAPAAPLPAYAYNEPTVTFQPATQDISPSNEVTNTDEDNSQTYSDRPVPEVKVQVKELSINDAVEGLQEEVIIVEKQNPQMTATLVTNTTIVVPALKEPEENKIQEALAATKKIVTELSWKAIENALAETVTKEDKQLLKEAYSQKLEAANWEKQADMLRLHYENINWEKATENLAIAIEGIKIDSVYNKYKEASHALTSYKKQLEQEINSKKEVKALNELIGQYQTFIIKVDSLRSKKIVEL